MTTPETLSAQRTSAEPEQNDWRAGVRKWFGILALAGDATSFAGGIYGAGVLKKFAAPKDPQTIRLEANELKELQAQGASKTKIWMHKNNELGQSFTGLAWGIGGLVMAKYGDPPKQLRQRVQAHKLERFLNEQGLDLPDEDKQQNPLLKGKGLLHKMDLFAAEHPTEILNVTFPLFATYPGYMYAGMVSQKKFNAAKLRGDTLAMDHYKSTTRLFWQGALMVTGGLFGLLVKEDPDAQKKAANGNIFEKAWATVKQTPLIVTGTLYAANDYWWATRCWKEWKDFTNTGAKFGTKKNLRILFSLPTFLTYTLANIILIFASRNTLNNSAFDPEQLGQIENIIAKSLLAQPADQHLSMAHSAAMFMKSHQMTTESPDKIAQDIVARVKALSPTAGDGPEPITQPQVQPVTNTPKPQVEAGSVTRDTVAQPGLALA